MQVQFENQRLEVLRGHAVLGSGPALEFDRIASLAGRLFAAPIALIYLADENRQWFKSQIGVDDEETSQALSICSHTIQSDSVVVIDDLTVDPRFAAAALGTGPAQLAFYAGAPLIAKNGSRIGTICVMDRKPRPGMSANDRTTLASLAEIVLLLLQRQHNEIALQAQLRHSDRIRELQTMMADASDCEALLDHILADLSRRHGASIGHVHRLCQTSHTIRRVSLYRADPHRSDFLYPDPTKGLCTSRSLVAETILADRRQVLDLKSIADLENYPFCQAALHSGLVSLVVQPIAVETEQFGLSLAFDTRSADLDAIMADITALLEMIRPALQRKIEQTRTRLLVQALDCAADGVLITHADLDSPGPTIAYVNASMTRMTGYSSAELIGRSPKMLQGADTDSADLADLGRRLRQQRPTRAVLLNYRKDGMPYWSEIDITPVVDEDGLLTNFVAVQRDVTEHLLADKARTARERLNQSLFEENPLPMWVTDSATLQFLDVNDAAVAHYGWSRAEFLSMTSLDIRAPEDRPEYLLSVAGSFDPSSNGRIWRHRRADGREILIRGSSHAVVFEGRDARMSVIWDVTDLETARREQAEGNNRLADLAANLDRRRQELADVQTLARLGSWRHIAGEDEAEGEVEWSDGMYALMGRSELDFTPDVRAVVACIHPEDRELARATFRAVLQTGVIAIEILRITRPDGEVLYLRWDARQLLDALGAVIGVYGYCQDITEMRRAQEALQRSEKLKSLGQLTGGIAHDFNNLLTVVTLNLEEVQDRLAPSDPLHGMVRSALHASGRGTELTAQLLSYARRSVLRPKAINLATTLMVLRPLLMRSLGKHYKLDIVLGDEEWELLIDPGQLDNALMNLVINARDAMPSGGTIQIQTSLALLGKAPNSVNFPPPDELRPGHYVVISVADSGVGISPEVLARVFEPFFTTKGIGQGSGLGLSMVFGFAKQSGGHVVVESEPGRGSVVRIFLPCHETSATTIVEPAPTFFWNANGLRVLVVEDQANVLEAVSRVMEAVGFCVTTAESAEEACEALRSGVEYDLLFTDIMLQGPINGLRVAQVAREVAPAIRILLTTGFTEHSVDTLDGQLLHAEFIMKPYKRAQLCETLRSLFPPERTRAGWRD